MYRIIREAVEECDTLIPEAWKERLDYRDRALFQRRRRYLMEYHLHRTAMRKRTGDFLKGCGRAMVRDCKQYGWSFASGNTGSASDVNNYRCTSR